jgi:hydrogenase/urease accessory protein HupE
MKAPKETTTRFAITLLTFLLYAQTVEAHVHKGEAVSFLSGLKHPISGLDHVFAMIAACRLCLAKTSYTCKMNDLAQSSIRTFPI